MATDPTADVPALRVCLFGTYDRELHPRIANLEAALRSAGAEVFEVQESAWPGRTEEKVALARNPLAPRTLWRLGHAWWRLARAYRRAPEHDVVLVGYFGHLDVLLARLLAGRDRVVLDMMLSIYDTVVLDRRELHPGSARARLARMLDRLAARSCRTALVDTAEQINFMADELRIPRERLAVVPVSADTAAFPRVAPNPAGRLRVLFVGTFVPLQGTGVVADAITRLADAPIDFTIVGTGQDRAAFDRIVKPRPGLDVRDWVPYDELGRLVAEHDVALGVFGTSGKAQRVVPNKAYQASSVGRAVVTADTPTMRAAFGDAAEYVPAGDGEALAAALLRLSADHERVAALGVAAGRRFDRSFSPKAIGGELVALLAETPPTRWVRPPRWLMRFDLLRNDLLPRLDRSRPVVELGYGSGAVLEEVARSGFVAVGSDFSASAAAIARSRLAALPADRRPEIRVGGFEALDDLHGKAGSVLLFEVLEHVEDDRGLLTEIHDFLGEDGALLLSVPAHRKRFSRVDEMAGHFRRYDRRELEDLLRDTGFAVETFWCYGYPLANILMAIRRLVTPSQSAASADDLRQRSTRSGHIVPLKRVVSAVVNTTTMAPFNLLQRAFLDRDLGEGYLVMARRVRPRSADVPAAAAAEPPAAR